MMNWEKKIDLLNGKEPNYIYKWENIEQDWEEIRNTLKKKSGVYMIACKLTGDFYVGSARYNPDGSSSYSGIYTRISLHLLYSNLNSPKFANHPFYSAINLYQKENFIIYILEIIESNDNDQIRQIETNYLQAWKPKYNFIFDGYGKGFISHSLETRQKLKEIALARNPQLQKQLTKKLIEYSSIPVNLIFIDTHEIKAYPTLKELFQDYPILNYKNIKPSEFYNELDHRLNNIILELRAYLAVKGNPSIPSYLELKQLLIDKEEAENLKKEKLSQLRRESSKIAVNRRETHAIQLTWLETECIKYYRNIKQIFKEYPQLGKKYVYNSAKEGQPINIEGAHVLIDYVPLISIPSDEQLKFTNEKNIQSPKIGMPIIVAHLDSQIISQYPSLREMSRIEKIDPKKVSLALSSISPLDKIGLKKKIYFDNCNIEDLPSWTELQNYYRDKVSNNNFKSKSKETRDKFSQAKLDLSDKKDAYILDLILDNNQISSYENISCAAKSLNISSDIINRRLANNTVFIKDGIQGHFQWRQIKKIKASFNNSFKIFNHLSDAAFFFNVKGHQIRKSIKLGINLNTSKGKIKFEWINI